jgi:predicted Zn-dependent protease
MNVSALFTSLRRVWRAHRLAAVSCSFAVLLSGCVSEPSAITGKKKSFGYSWEQEMKLGAEADKEITEEMGLYENPQVQSYVEQLGQRVLQSSDFKESNTPELYRDTKFTFRVLDSPVVNAFALPGGYVYVTRGLLSHVQNEAQLAVVLGHEIGHVAARHSSQQARRAQIGQIGLIAGAILGQQVLGDRAGDMGNLVNLGGQALEMFMMRYSREAEFEADNLGVGYALRGGYAAAEGAKFFQSLQRLSASEGRSIPTWQSTHPDPGDRAQRVIQLAAKTPVTPQIVAEEEYLRRIEGLVVGNDPREGFTQNGVFYHPGLRFQFNVAPGWKVDNQKAAVLLAEPNNQAMMGFRLAPGTRARDAATKFVQESKVQVTASGDTMINGLPATVILGQGQSEQGTLGVWNAFIEMDGKVFSFMGLAPAQVFNQMRPSFENIAAGFSPLRDARMATVQPARLRLARVDRVAPFASFVPTSLPPDLKPEELAIMNQVTMNEALPAGRLIKVPDSSPQFAASVNANQAPATYPAQPGAAPLPTAPPGTVFPSQPSASGYPQQPSYPQSGYPASQPYPPAGQPGQTYPSSQYPQNYPQPQNSPPVWPR